MTHTHTYTLENKMTTALFPLNVANPRVYDPPSTQFYHLGYITNHTVPEKELNSWVYPDCPLSFFWLKSQSSPIWWSEIDRSIHA